MRLFRVVVPLLVAGILPCVAQSPTPKHPAESAPSKTQSSPQSNEAEVADDSVIRRGFNLLLDPGLSIRRSEGFADPEAEKLLNVPACCAVRSEKCDGAVERFGRNGNKGSDGRGRPVIDTCLCQWPFAARSTARFAAYSFQCA